MPRDPWNNTDWTANSMDLLHVGEWPQSRSYVLAQDPMQDKPSRPACPAEIPGEQAVVPVGLLGLSDVPRPAKSQAGAYRLAALAGAKRLPYRR